LLFASHHNGFLFHYLPLVPVLKSAESDLFEKVRNSTFFEEYRLAFETATGLPLDLTRSDQIKFALCSRKHGENKFCQIMSEKGVDCDTCRLLNLEVWEQIRKETGFGESGICSVPATLKSPDTIERILASRWNGPKTFECFAGMCETMVPIKTSNGVVGFLKTGQVLLKEPSHQAFKHALQRIEQLQQSIDPSLIEEAYFKTPVVPSCQYEAMVTLLKSFATQISKQVEQLYLENDQDDPRIVKRAKDYIHKNYSTPVNLESLAKAISVSPAHLSRVFKDATGSGYLEYLNRYRIEQSKILLKKKEMRISEIAFEVGFQSLAPFNKAFRNCTGKTPKDFRSGE